MKVDWAPRLTIQKQVLNGIQFYTHRFGHCPGVAWEDGIPNIDDYGYQIVYSDGATEWELLAECIDPKIERLLMWLGACDMLDVSGDQVVAFGQVLYVVQDYEPSCSTPGAWFAELDVYCIASDERVTVRFQLATEHFAKDNSPGAQ